MQQKRLAMAIVPISLLLVACNRAGTVERPAEPAMSGSIVEIETMLDAPNERTPKTADSLEISGFSGGMVKITITASGTMLVGNASAPRLMIFSDYDCSYCRRFSATDLPWIEQETISGRLAIEHVFVPMSNDGESAASLAVCAAEQGKFSNAHRWLSTHAIHTIDQKKFAATLSLNLKKLSTCTLRKDLLKRHLKKAEEYRVERVPFFVLGSNSWLGIITEEELQGKIDTIMGH